MNLNILKPKQAVESAFSAPNPLVTVVLVLVAWLVLVGMAMFLGVPFNPVAFVLGLLPLPLVLGIVLPAVIFVVAALMKGNEAKSNFSQIFSATGLMWVPIIVMLVVALAAIPFVFSPLTLDFIGQFASGESSFQEVAIGLHYLVENGLGSMLGNEAALSAVLVVTGLLALFNLYILYRIVSKVFSYRIVPNILVTVFISFATLLVMGIIGAFLP